MHMKLRTSAQKTKGKEKCKKHCELNALKWFIQEIHLVSNLKAMSAFDEEQR